MKLKLLLIFAVVVIGLLIVFLGPVILKGPVRKEIPQEKAAIKHAVIAKGVVESKNHVEISSKVSGLIIQITANEGEKVTKGRALIMLDNQEKTAQVKEMEALTKKADANYSKAKADYERYRRLYDGNAATLDELETFERQFKFAEAELAETNSKLDRAKTVLRDYTLKSPIDGIVITKHLEPGETAGEGTPILTLADLNSLKITAELDETDVGKIQIGQKAEVSADAYRGSTYYGKVDKISEDVKRKKIRTFDPIVWMDINTQEITIALDSFEGLVIGMTVDVKFNQE